MSETIITCIVCPVGCRITVVGDGGAVASLEGAQCARGDAYARDEYTLPVRILTSTVRVAGAEPPLAPVRSNRPVPKKSLFDCMADIRRLTLAAPVRAGDVIIRDICGTGADIVATGSAL